MKLKTKPKVEITEAIFSFTPEHIADEWAEDSIALLPTFIFMFSLLNVKIVLKTAVFSLKVSHWINVSFVQIDFNIHNEEME